MGELALGASAARPLTHLHLAQARDANLPLPLKNGGEGISLQARASLDLAPVKAPAPTKDQAAASKAAEEFEAVFIAEILGAMFEGVKTDGPFGGGFGEDVFRSLLLDRYGRSLASQGGFGIADAVKRQLLSYQEQQP